MSNGSLESELMSSNRQMAHWNQNRCRVTDKCLTGTRTDVEYLADGSLEPELMSSN
ncbi:hypothetical protein J6590_010527 [Homalodisca vitripennis]|nr:hypothetical protein J6590_010527 [Homalodisca vitripennis]